MTKDLAQLIDTYCQAGSEPDAQRRAQLLAQVWSDGATYTDPTVHAAGSGEFLAHIAKVVAAVRLYTKLGIREDVMHFDIAPAKLPR